VASQFLVVHSLCYTLYPTMHTLLLTDLLWSRDRYLSTQTVQSHIKLCAVQFIICYIPLFNIIPHNSNLSITDLSWSRVGCLSPQTVRGTPSWDAHADWPHPHGRRGSGRSFVQVFRLCHHCYHYNWTVGWIILLALYSLHISLSARSQSRLNGPSQNSLTSQI